MALIDILLASLEALAATGQVDAACRLAGEPVPSCEKTTRSAGATTRCCIV